MKRGDIVVPTWGRRLGRKAKLQHKDIGIIVATRPANANKYNLISREGYHCSRSGVAYRRAVCTKWYHYTHWQKVNDFVKEA